LQKDFATQYVEKCRYCCKSLRLYRRGHCLDFSERLSPSALWGAATLHHAEL